jgi:uncharacterized membrane protein
VSNPSAVDVTVRDGSVLLAGEVLTHEATHLVAAVERVPGVCDVEDRVERHDDPDAAARLHRDGARRTQPLWSPARRLAIGVAGGALAAWGLARRGAGGRLLAGTGAALLVRSFTNRPLGHLLGRGAPAGAVDLQKTIRIEAPVEDVYRLWSQFEKLPTFMSHLAEVRRVGDDRYHWIARGPAGVDLDWIARVTAREDNRLLAWESEPGSAIGTAGRVRFEPEGEATRVQVQMSYTPPAGVAGHAVARLFGADARTAIDHDLTRLKSLLEHGKTTAASGTEVRLSDLEDPS